MRTTKDELLLPQGRQSGVHLTGSQDSSAHASRRQYHLQQSLDSVLSMHMPPHLTAIGLLYVTFVENQHASLCDTGLSTLLVWGWRCCGWVDCFMSQQHASASQGRICSDSLVGLVVKASVSRAEDPGFESHLRQDFSGSSHTSDLKLALQWLPCQVPGVIGSPLGLVGPVSV